MAWGEYPAGYNPNVHGPYDPARFYGKGIFQNIFVLYTSRLKEITYVPPFAIHRVSSNMLVV
jgi:hypothetical protein